MTEHNSGPTKEIRLREVHGDDPDIFFKQQLDPEANNMAAFTSKEPANREAFNRHWKKILEDEKIIIRTILYEKRVAGHILSFEQFGEREISYWIGKEFWGKSIASQALSIFLKLISDRPLYARAAKDNIASIRVLEKCGFEITGEDKGFSNARGEEVEEYILVLKL